MNAQEQQDHVIDHSLSEGNPLFSPDESIVPTVATVNRLASFRNGRFTLRVLARWRHLAALVEPGRSGHARISSLTSFSHAPQDDGRKEEEVTSTSF